MCLVLLKDMDGLFAYYTVNSLRLLIPQILESRQFCKPYRVGTGKHWSERAFSRPNYNRHNNNNNNNVYGAVIVTYSHCESSPGSSNECRSAPGGRRPSNQPSQPTIGRWVRLYRLLWHPPSPFIITQPEGWYLFYRPSEGGRLSQPRHTACSPIQYYRTTLHTGVRNLPKVFTR